MIHTGILPKDTECAKYNGPNHIVKIARSSFHILKIIISHYFLPEVEYCFQATKSFENIYFNTSALADDAVVKMTGFQKIRKVLTESADERPENVLFGTDYSAFDFKKHIDLVKLLELTDAQKERNFGETRRHEFQFERSRKSHVVIFPSSLIGVMERGMLGTRITDTTRRIPSTFKCHHGQTLLSHCAE